MKSTPPLPGLRRIVTAHREAYAVVQADSMMLAQPAGTESLRGCTLWLNGSVPATDNNNDEDGATRNIANGFIVPTGTALMYTDLAPGATIPMHRTRSLDYNILIQGELTLTMDDGTEKHLKNPGEVVIQKGTMHAWRNPGGEWTRWVSVTIGAEPVVVDGKPLEEKMKLP